MIEVDEEVVLEAEGVVHAGVAFELRGDVFVGEGPTDLVPQSLAGGLALLRCAPGTARSAGEHSLLDDVETAPVSHGVGGGVVALRAESDYGVTGGVGASEGGREIADVGEHRVYDACGLPLTDGLAEEVGIQGVLCVADVSALASADVLEVEFVVGVVDVGSVVEGVVEIVVYRRGVCVRVPGDEQGGDLGEVLHDRESGGVGETGGTSSRNAYAVLGEYGDFCAVFVDEGKLVEVNGLAIGRVGREVDGGMVVVDVEHGDLFPLPCTERAAQSEKVSLTLDVFIDAGETTVRRRTDL